MKEKLSLVIPTYNEAGNIENLCLLAAQTLNACSINFEIIIVDDNSPDGTWRIAQELAGKYGYIKAFRRMYERSLGTAVVFGWQNSNGEILGVIDGDLQHPPEILPGMLELISRDNETDIVVASRNIKGGGVSRWSPWRRFISWFATQASLFLIPDKIAKVKDPMSGYFILRREVVQGARLEPMGYKILLEVLAKGNYKKVSEVPYFFQERKKGGSKAGLRQYLTSFIYMLKLSRQVKKDKKN